jgi:hypothetical protein
MAINPLSGAGTPTIAGAGSTPKATESFGKVMKGQVGKSPAAPPRLENAPTPVNNGPVGEARKAQQTASAQCRVEGTKAAASTEASRSASAAKVLNQVTAAQTRMEQVLKLAESGKAFSPAELLSLQAHVYRASQELDLAGKVVEKATGGVKQVLQTQV